MCLNALLRGVSDESSSSNTAAPRRCIAVIVGDDSLSAGTLSN